MALSKEDYICQYERDQAGKAESADIAREEMRRKAPTFLGFLNDCASESVNGGSGEWQERECPDRIGHGELPVWTEWPDDSETPMLETCPRCKGTGRL